MANRAAGISLGALAAALVLAGSPAQAMCSIGSPPIVADFQRQVNADPARALAAITAQLARKDLGRIDRAWLYAAQALAYSTLERSEDEVVAANAGLALAPSPRDAPHMELLAQLAFGQSDPAALKPIADRIKAARRFVTPNSIEDICSRAVIGSLSREPVAEIRELGAAYRLAIQQGMAEQRALLAIDVAGVLMKAGDSAEALALIDEGERWARANNLTFLTASTAFRRAMTHTGMKDFVSSIGGFDTAYRLSLSLGNRNFAAFAVMSKCQSLLSLKRFGEAEGACNEAERLFGDDQMARPRLMAYRSRIAYGLKRYPEAVALTTAILEAPASRSAIKFPLYQTRGMAQAGLGNFREAYADMKRYADMYRDDIEAKKSREAATLASQVEIERQVDRNKALEREVVFEQERARYERQRLILLGGVAGALALALALFLWMGRRHRRALEALASSDGLTGLPNRRHATEQGSVALARAADARSPLSLGLIDIDYFKRINDAEGHAAGDAALRDLSAILKSAVRRSDVIGRWGGEEFLLMLPGLSAAETAEVLGRIRAEALRLERPLRFSAGIAAAAAGERDLEAVVARADAALYEAKRSGRSRTVIAADASPSPDRRGEPEGAPQEAGAPA
ncbi:GGDEF domain-containing protein [Sphingomonas hengshuiensis]|uniref:GGDEF domain-containing protein n=1 Tax=Sphingomonas hengshuiensis TaxID=1609977 RepID=UPI0012B6E649|nr:GGDEF domain-containing protein [Sphingomonas hengshuiensis]